jgi:hypothetical protein
MDISFNTVAPNAVLNIHAVARPSSVCPRFDHVSGKVRQGYNA